MTINNVKILVFILISSVTTVHAAIKTEIIEYKVDGVLMKGFMAFDDTVKGQRPGILVVHEWWGHNAYAKDRAKMLAKLGYTAFALDMYGNGKQAAHPKDASKFSGQVMAKLDTAEARFNKALSILQQHETTNSKKIAAIGYCFGGSIVLEMARRGVDLDAVVSFHGSLKIITTPKPGVIKTKTLVLNGKQDPFVKQQQIDNFKKVMTKAKISYEFVNYKGAKHSFTNPGATAIGKKFGLPLEYNEAADKKSWTKMQQLLNSTFK